MYIYLVTEQLLKIPPGILKGVFLIITREKYFLSISCIFIVLKHKINATSGKDIRYEKRR